MHPVKLGQGAYISPVRALDLFPNVSSADWLYPPQAQPCSSAQAARAMLNGTRWHVSVRIVLVRAGCPWTRVDARLPSTERGLGTKLDLTGMECMCVPELPFNVVECITAK